MILPVQYKTPNLWFHNCRLVLIAFCICLISTYSYSYELPPVKNYSLEHGLSQISVYDIVEDKEGFIWVATQAGVDRFNGNELINIDYLTNGQNNLNRRYTHDLAIDQNSGDIFMVGRDTLFVYRYEQGIVEEINLDFLDSSEQLTVYHVDREHHFLATTKAIYIRQADLSYKAITPASFNSLVNQIKVNEGYVWVATDKGLLTYSLLSQTWEQRKYANYSIKDFLFVNDEEIWFATASKGVLIVPKDATTVSTRGFSVENGLISNVTTSLMLTAANNIWVGTIGGVSIFENSKDNTPSNSALPNQNDARVHSVYKLFESSQGIVFYGTRASGLGVIDPNALLVKDASIDKVARTLMVERGAEQDMWVTTDIGVWQIDNELNAHGPYTFAPNSGYTTANNVLTLHYANSETIWVGTRTSLAKLDLNDMTIKHQDFDGKFVYSIYSDETDNLWVGTFNSGLYHYDPKKKEILNHFTLSSVVGFYRDSPTRLWVAAFDGLYLVNPMTYQMISYKHDPNDPTSLPTNSISWISKLNSGEFIIGTQNKGIGLMNFDEQTQTISVSRKLANTELGELSIGAIFEDEYGNIWVTTTHNIAKITPEFSSIQYFDSDDGAKPSGYYIGSLASFANGQFAVSGPDGISLIDPLNFKTNTRFPNVVITSISKTKRMGHDIKNLVQVDRLVSKKDTALVELTQNDLMLTIGFTGIDFGSTDDIQYQYRLLGFDENWQQTEQGIRQATFTNLDPGEYIFEVKSTNRYGDWSSQSTSVTILVIPPWYKTDLAIFLYLCFIVIVLYGLYAWRTYKLRIHSQQLAIKVEEKTEELQTANNKLKKLSVLDPLTNILNRRGFEESMKALRESANKNASYGLILLDIDNFKKINDYHGHDVGDKTLENLALLLKESLRTEDLLARWGGEEFIILISAKSASDISKVAVKLKRAIEETPIYTANGVLHITATLGVVELPELCELEPVVKSADKLLYEGKRAGRNKVVFAGAIF